MTSSKTFIIAEAGVNHNGSIEKAINLVDMAKDSGADAVKFQTFNHLKNYNVKYCAKKTLEWAKSLELTKLEFIELYNYCREKEIIFISTPFDKESLLFLNELGVEIVKVASTGLFEIPLLKHVAKIGKPVIMSTGMGDENDIKRALSTLRDNWNSKTEFDLTLLYCVSLYPASYETIDLNKIDTISKITNCDIGYSDHSIGIEIPIAAVALGAKIIEKHLKLSKNQNCPDKEVSLDPTQFKIMVSAIRNVEKSKRSGEMSLSKSEIKSRMQLRKGLYAARNMRRGTIVKENDVLILKPSGSIGIELYSKIIGKKLKDNIKYLEPFKKVHIF